MEGNDGRSLRDLCKFISRNWFLGGFEKAFFGQSLHSMFSLIPTDILRSFASLRTGLGKEDIAKWG